MSKGAKNQSSVKLFYLNIKTSPKKETWKPVNKEIEKKIILKNIPKLKGRELTWWIMHVSRTIYEQLFLFPVYICVHVWFYVKIPFLCVWIAEGSVLYLFIYLYFCFHENITYV